MVLKGFVPVVQRLWREEIGRLCSRPISPKQAVNTVESKFLCLMQVGGQIILGVGLGSNDVSLSQRQGCCARLMSKWITKIFVVGNRQMRCFASHSGQHKSFLCVHHI
jgi:hypothetical protein